MKTFLLFILMISINLLKAQQSEYKLLKSEQGIEIYMREIECHNDQNGIHQLFYQLQFINTTNFVAKLQWNIDLWMNATCITCNKPKTPENTYFLTLLPGQSVEGLCEQKTNDGLKVYIRELYNNRSSILTKFEIVNLKVEFYE